MLPETEMPIPGAETALNGPMDLDLVELEAQAMQAAGIPFALIPGHDQIGFDTGHPIPGGGCESA